MPARSDPAAAGALRLDGRVRRWSCPAPPIDAARILRVHRYSDPSKVRPVIRVAAERAVAEVARLARPEACHVAVPIAGLDGERLRLDGGIAFECGAFGQHLAGSTHLLAFVITIGPDLDTTVIGLIEDAFEPLDALFLETAGWLVIEAATRTLAGHLKREYRGLGLALSLRMGPGYDYRPPAGTERIRWDLWQQRELFQMFGAEPLPIELMESCVMKPKMSRSGVFGLLPDAAARAV